MTGTIGRVDYVRLRHASDGLERADLAEQWRERAELVAEELGISRRCYGNGMYYDSGLKKKISFFNIWGPGADLFFERLKLEEMRYLIRLDWREPIEPGKVDFEEMFITLKRKYKGTKRCDWLTSPPREKNDGRDTGGNSINIGAPGSQRRVSVYERGQEGPVWEFQIGGAALRNSINKWLSDHDNTDTRPVDTVRRQLERAAHAQFVKVIGITPVEMEDGTKVQGNIADYTDPEHVLHQMDLLWDILPPAAQESFLETHSTLDEHTIARVTEAHTLLDAANWMEEPDELREALEAYGSPSELVRLAAVGYSAEDDGFEA